jgi:hypothetical protein
VHLIGLMLVKNLQLVAPLSPMRLQVIHELARTLCAPDLHTVLSPPIPQVLSSAVAWHVASKSTTVQAEGIVATSAGQHALKGIISNVELLSCSLIACAAGSGEAGGAVAAVTSSPHMRYY